MQLNKYDEVYQEIVIEMFNRVNIFMDYEGIKEFAKDSEWFTKCSWSETEEKSFHEWVVSLLRQRLKYSKKQAEKQAVWLIFDIGWKVNR